MYIGKHKANEHDAKYYGSGKVLNRAIKKYGLENFTNEIIDVAYTLEELNKKEKYYISLYKEEYGNMCYNIASGGDGGNTQLYKTEEEKQEFINKMTQINRGRCNSDDFKKKLSEATTKRYEDESVREAHSSKLKDVWSDECLRNQQSERLKKHYEEHGDTRVMPTQKCMWQLDNAFIEFNSIKDLREFLVKYFKYNPDRRSFNNIMNSGVGYKPFHKNNIKLNKLKGMLLSKLEKGVETKGDECNPVEVEIDTTSKCEAM